MGVHGLWKLIDSAGKPIPVETLENKVLAVDVSIWLYQLVRGFHETSGRPVHNAFLLGLFHRICKLLFYRIKPIFVFDGGVPSLKKKTIAARQKSRQKAEEINEKLRQQLLENFIKQQAIGSVIGGDFALKKILPSTKDDLFKLPPIAEAVKKEIDEGSSSSDEENYTKYGNIHDIDVKSEEFLNLPPDIRHDILTELKETRKQNSWAKVHLMPEESMEFSSFQMKRLLKRRAVQEGLEQAEDELGARGFTLNDLQTMLTEQGVDLSQRIASDNTTRYIYSTSPDPTMRQILLDGPSSAALCNKNSSDLIKEEEEISELEFGCVKDDMKEVPSEQEEPKGLTQEEILQLIKLDTSQNCPSSSAGPSTSKQAYLGICDENDVLNRVETDVQSNVNDQAVEHGKNQKEDNNRLKLDHESLPQTDSYCQDSTMLQKDSPLSYNQPKENGSKKNILHILPLTNVQHSQVLINERVSERPYRESTETVERKHSVLESKVETLSEGSSDDDGDFVDVEPSEVMVNSERKMEIIIKPNENLNDDIFADIFTAQQSVNNELIMPKDNTINTSNIKNKLDRRDENEKKIAGNLSTSEVDINDEIQKNNGKNGKPNFEAAIKHSQEVNEVLENSQKNSTLSMRTTIELSTDQLEEKIMDLENESVELLAESKKNERMAASITEQITLDAQELLQLFGIPFIVAPMEAEAQCAYLDFSGQTDGTITDDSDIWLFGANNVYKNFFEQKKFVKQFKATDIQRFYKLKRDDLIMIAMLVGSDYTVGIHGVGPVNAIEIVAHFPPKDEASTPNERLQLFREAYHSSRLNVHLQRKLKSLQFTDGFPSSEIVKAYYLPMVDNSKERFSWSQPNVEGIKQFANSKLGWDFNKTSQILKPVLDRLKQKTTQKTMHNYFNWSFDQDDLKLSKRVSKAVNIISTGVIPSPPKIFKKDNAPNQLKKQNQSFSETIVLRSKTPAQVAREKAVKKLKEYKKREEEKKLQKSKARGNKS
ncbi:DNA repair protein complementing XP-G cells homolog [Cimex lectularius]|uniref:DNA repair protein complementing XP-G cells homolog n=1 Tax=Cimex lectularius TaxID=79782 RepID=A0A8I6RJX4_CIMLE|nr:DNA repair protein complementing XP-G cells homolog [Cimex lectularius]XP_014247755.1 DNA repair protein complementing XP-G cells homolog [Cimex lectularius]